jgi:uncharacterized iron-regulated protein
MSAPSGAEPQCSPPIDGWVSPHAREHALVGKIWDVAQRAFVDRSVALAKLEAARFVLLGERHDNLDHHRLQAEVVSALGQRGSKPALVFEMLEVEQQAELDQALAAHFASLQSVAEAVDWGRSGWPPFCAYEPLFDAALRLKLPIHAGNLAKADARGLVKHGSSALPAERAAELHLHQELPEQLTRALHDELRVSHCGHLPESMLPGMALAQRARDAQMARVLASLPEPQSAVLIAGAGHVRRDRGVPLHLERFGAEGGVVSLAFLEAHETRQQPDDYAQVYGAAVLPFDLAWFTPRANNDDPCAAFKRR